MKSEILENTGKRKENTTLPRTGDNLLKMRRSRPQDQLQGREIVQEPRNPGPQKREVNFHSGQKSLI